MQLIHRNPERVAELAARPTDHSATQLGMRIEHRPPPSQGAPRWPFEPRVRCATLGFVL
jgi:hypothetical protein